MTLTNANTLDNQVDYLSDNGSSFADTTLNSIFNASPRNAVDDDEDEDDDLIPDTDDDLYDDDDEDLDADTYTDADELDKIDDDDDADVIDDDIDDDDDKGSVTSGLNGGSSFADRPLGRTTGRMTDHEPGSGQ